MKFGLLSLCLLLWLLSPIFPLVVSTIVFGVRSSFSQYIVLGLTWLFAALAVYTWHTYRKEQVSLPLEGFKTKPQETVFGEYLDLLIRSGKFAKKKRTD